MFRLSINQDILLGSRERTSFTAHTQPATCLSASAVGNNYPNLLRIKGCSKFGEDTETYKGTTRIDKNV